VRDQAGRRRGHEQARDPGNEWVVIEAGTTDDEAWTADDLPDAEPETSQRVTLIEFTWVGARGAQPVIFVSREWLQ